MGFDHSKTLEVSENRGELEQGFCITITTTALKFWVFRICLFQKPDNHKIQNRKMKKLKNAQKGIIGTHVQARKSKI